MLTEVHINTVGLGNHLGGTRLRRAALGSAAASTAHCPLPSGFSNPSTAGGPHSGPHSLHSGAATRDHSLSRTHLQSDQPAEPAPPAPQPPTPLAPILAAAPANGQTPALASDRGDEECGAEGAEGGRAREGIAVGVPRVFGESAVWQEGAEDGVAATPLSAASFPAVASAAPPLHTAAMQARVNAAAIMIGPSLDRTGLAGAGMEGIEGIAALGALQEGQQQLVTYLTVSAEGKTRGPRSPHPHSLYITLPFYTQRASTQNSPPPPPPQRHSTGASGSSTGARRINWTA